MSFSDGGDFDGRRARRRGPPPSDGGVPDQQFPADAGVPCRNPFDPAPYPEEQVNDPGPNFPSLFMAKDVEHTLTGEELAHVWKNLNSLISRSLETKSTPGDVVNMVKKFYDEKVRAEFDEAPDWSEFQIHNYIFVDQYRQADDNISAVQKTIDLLRSQLAVRTDDVVKVNTESVKLLLSCVKTHASLVDAKRKRDANR